MRIGYVMILAGYLTGIWYFMSKIEKEEEANRSRTYAVWVKIGVLIGAIIWPVFLVSGILDELKSGRG